MSYVPPPRVLTREEFERNGCRDPELEKWAKEQQQRHRFGGVMLTIASAMLLAVVIMAALKDLK